MLIPLHQTVSTEANLLIRNSVEIDNKIWDKVEIDLVDNPKAKRGNYPLSNKH